MESFETNHVVIYTALTTSSKLWIRGRLISNVSKPILPGDSIWTVLVKTISSSLTRELKYHPLVVNWSDQSHSIKTDKEGYFEVFEPLGSSPITIKGNIKYTLDGASHSFDFNLTECLDQCGEGIISDIDDTILMTKVKSFFRLKMIFNSVFINPFRRKTIDGASELFRKMAHKKQINIVAYISNSPWNMYAYLRSFLSYNRFPKGILSLRDFGMQMLKKKEGLEKQNKFLEIKKVMELFPSTVFTLIGDTAEYDYDVYRLAQIHFPNQVKKIIIRKTGNRKNERRILNDLSAKQSNSIIVVKKFEQVIV